ncbi:MAG: L-threonylcarbamoyladenylate synthase [Patescibacteria group bacterium]
MFGENKSEEIINILKNGGIGILPTDTIYGLVGRALLPRTVEKIYKVRRRQPDKPFIILINSIADLKLFNIKINKKTRTILKKYWPGPVSIILPCPEKGFEYLHRGTKTLAFRLSDKNDLIKILKQTGPLVAPSANPEGLEPAKTIKQAKKYFNNQVDFYFDAGAMESEPSTLIRIENGKIEILRQGAIKI